jgi:putative N6-adenine-specific DNA methylase
VLADELRGLGATVRETPSGGVRFEGDTHVALMANLHSRIASRVLQQVAHGSYRGEDDLYRLAHETEWERWHDPLTSLRVDTTAVGAPVRSLQFTTLRIKDGIVDRARERVGDRPSIEKQRPDRRVFAFLDAGRCTLYLDWSGESLFKRGWRRDGVEAPMKENLAAGLLAIAGWQPGMALLDPFCGSGTIVVEAAMIAAGVPPGVQRPFAFERMRGFDRNAWERMRRVVPRAPPAAASIFGSDVSESAIAAARANLARCGADPRWVSLRQIDVLHLEAAPAPTGLLLTNPPYGERMDDANIIPMYKAIGDHLKHACSGLSAWIISSDEAALKRVGLKPSRKFALINGTLTCKFYRFDLFAGKRNERFNKTTDTPSETK